MSCQVIEKDPSEKKRVVFDFSEFLGSSEIASASFTVPSGLTSAAESNTTTTATIWLTGGTDGQEYDLKCCATTNDSETRIECHTVKIAVTANC